MRWRVEERIERGVDKTKEERGKKKQVMQVHKYSKGKEKKTWNKPKAQNTVISHTPCFKQPKKCRSKLRTQKQTHQFGPSMREGEGSRRGHPCR